MDKRKILNYLRKRIIVCSLVLTMISGMLSACGTSEDQETVADTEMVADADTLGNDKQSVVETQSPTDADESAITEESGEETDEETAIEEVVEAPQTIPQWAKSIDVTEPKLTIWNENTKEGRIIENGNTYIIDEFDTVVLCYDGVADDCSNLKARNVSVSLPILESAYLTKRYYVFEFSELPSEPLKLEVDFDIAGYDFYCEVEFVSEDFANLVGGDFADWVPGKEWAESLEFDTVKLLAWNDSLNTKTVIDEGGEYQMQEGDVLYLCTPEPFWGYGGVNPEGFMDGISSGIIGYNLSHNSNPINFKIDISTYDGELYQEEFIYEKIKNYTFACTLYIPIE